MKNLLKISLVVILFSYLLYFPVLGQEETVQEKTVLEEPMEEVPVEQTTVSKTQQQGLTLWQTIKAGGWVMGILFLMSIAGVALVIDSFITLKEKRFISRTFLLNIKSDLERGELGKAIQRCDQTRGELSSILKAGFDSFGKGFEQMKEAVQIAGEIEAESIMQRISYLSVIGTLSPLFGLLGTVLGMIQAFNTIALESALGKPQLLALSISKALITTAGGLIIALPTMGFYFYFRGKGTKIIMKLEAVANGMINELKDRKRVS